MTPSDLLASEAQAFAQRLTDLLNGTIVSGTEVTVYVYEGQLLATVAPGACEKLNEIRPLPISTARSQEERQQAPLWLKLYYRVGLDAEQEHLSVETSVFGLCINPTTGHCPIRVEYDRSKTTKQQAHVHIQGESAGLGYAYAVVGRSFKDMQKLHFPVGGRRFRPTLEDFIEFLAQEKLVKGKEGWKKVLGVSRADWEYRQTRAAVRRDPTAAVDQLRSMGYDVTRKR